MSFFRNGPVSNGDLHLSVEDAEGNELIVNPGYALLVTLAEEKTKNVISITPKHVSNKDIDRTVDVTWRSNAPDVAAVTSKTTQGSTSNHIDLIAHGTTTVTVSIREGKENQQSTSLVIVVAPGMLLFGPDGRYYHLDASAWRAKPISEDEVPLGTNAQIEHGSVLFTPQRVERDNIPSLSDDTTCYVINLASMSNSLVSGQQFRSRRAAKE